MDVQFVATEEQAMLRDAVRRWAAERDVRTAEDLDTTWSYGAEQGWLMAGLPEEAGGLGGNAYDSAIIAEELGRGLVRAPFVEVMAAARVLLAAGPQLCEPIAAGANRVVIAHDEPAMRGDCNALATAAQASGEHWLLSGHKSGIVGAAGADSFIVSARIDTGEIGLFQLDAAGAPLRPFVTFDDRSGGELLLARTEARLLLRGEPAATALAAALDHALVLESAEALGAMEAALQMTRDYLLTRKQYGQLIGEFQALRHRLADMFIETEQARSIVLLGCAALEGSDPHERARIAAAVRARVAQAGQFVGAQGIQLHGGIGVTDEYPVGHFFKRLFAFSLRHGGEARQVERYAELMHAPETAAG